MERDSIKVCITGAAGNLAYSFIPILVSGYVFGPRTSIHLTLLDLSSKEYALKGLYLELEDGAFPLLKKIEYGSDPKKMFEGCDLVLFLGGASRQPGQERRDLLQINGQIFSEQGEALNEVAKPTCKCLVVANPCHTNCLILRKHCPKLPNANFTALSRLDHNRAVAQVSYSSMQVNNVFRYHRNSVLALLRLRKSLYGVIIPFFNIQIYHMPKFLRRKLLM